MWELYLLYIKFKKFDNKNFYIKKKIYILSSISWLVMTTSLLIFCPITSPQDILIKENIVSLMQDGSGLGICCTAQCLKLTAGCCILKIERVDLTLCVLTCKTKKEQKIKRAEGNSCRLWICSWHKLGV